LGLDLLRRLDPDAPKLAFSSLSVVGMASPLLAGADAATAAALSDVLRISQPAADHHAALSALLGELDDVDRGWGFEWGAGFWHRPSLTVEPGWVDQVGPLYGVAPEPLDFQADGEAARTTLNAWVEDHTRCLIPEFYPPGYDFSRTVHVAIHAMGLEARWEEPFDAAFTSERTFRRAGGADVSAPFMRSESFAGAVATADGVSVLRLPYQGADLAMYIVLPDAPTRPADLLDGLDAAALDAWVGLPARQGRIALSMPKWTTTNVHDLRPPLDALGYEPLVNAPLPAICDGCAMPDVVRQVVVVLVDEDGTRAAAATSGETNDSEPSWIEVDRPFLWLLRDDASGVVMWMGWVGDPT
ncbi:MAG TPA: serpin family protein, partial [Myxococcota bacterium]|nr:serpin family protein [Myxococcota bacterium]